jgi:hypothetical protein
MSLVNGVVDDDEHIIHGDPDIDNNGDDGLDVEFINVFTLYYQKAFLQDKCMFDDIDYDKLDSVNRIQELLYDEMKKYDELEHNEDNITINKPRIINFDDYNEVYCLKINNIDIAVCCSLIALLKYIQSKLDWKNENWIVIKLK